MKLVEIIVAFAFSKEGTCNGFIASHAVDLARKFDVPVFTQEDIKKRMSEFSPVATIVAAEEGYLSTLGIVSQLKAAAKAPGWHRVAVVAAPCHYWRCVRDLQKMGFKVVDVGNLKRRAIPWWNPFDPQVWVHNPFIWWVREIPVRLLPWWLYSRIT